MQKTEWTITENHWDYKIENTLFTYSEWEKEQNIIAKNNAELVLTPKFIPLYPKLLQNGFWLIEAVLFGFIDFFLENTNNKFYCTNEQLAQLLNCSEHTISTAIKNLEQKWVIELHKKMRAWWWVIRFIKKWNLENAKIAFWEMQKLHWIYNKIIDNNKIINENEKIENQNQEHTQEINNYLPKQNECITNLTNGDLTFENIYNLFYHKSWHKPSIEKCKKVFDSLNLDTEWYNLLVNDLKLFRIEYKYWIKDQMYRPWFEKYVGWFNAEWVNAEYRLKTIIKFHMENRENIDKMKKRYKDLCDTFWKETIDSLVKEYGRSKNKITLNIN